VAPFFQSKPTVGERRRKNEPNPDLDAPTKRTVMTIGMVTPPHENGRVRACVMDIVSHPIFRASQ
jgi:hypothetical protein